MRALDCDLSDCGVVFFFWQGGMVLTQQRTKKPEREALFYSDSVVRLHKSYMSRYEVAVDRKKTGKREVRVCCYSAHLLANEGRVTFELFRGV